MKALTVSILLGALSATSCFSSTHWNAAQIGELRRRAAFDMSCAPEDLDLVEIARDNHGLIKKVRADGCGKRLTFVNAKSGTKTAQWMLGTNQFQASHQHAQR